MIKSFFGLIFLAVIGYGVVVVDMVGQTFASHVADIWRAPIVQKKVELVKDGVGKDLAEKINEAKKELSQKAKKEFREKLMEGEISAEDRASLKKLLEDSEKDGKDEDSEKDKS